MTNEQFSQGLKKNIDRVREYELGMDGTGGKCDCIGLIIGAIRLAGGKWTGTHGSNYAARNAMQGFGKITSPSQLRVNDIVFKHRAPGEENYALPASYKGHADPNDYYHVGVVTGIAPLVITHCTGVSGGIKKDTSLGKWSHTGTYKGLDDAVYETESYFVTGGKLKVRTGPGEKYPVTDHLANGAQVSGTKEENGWVFLPEKRGYCMARYLQKAQNASHQKAVQLLEKALLLLRETEGSP